MIILIDGYNFIKSVMPVGAKVSAVERSWFLQQLSRYIRIKQMAISEMIVVFDGGDVPYRQREVHGGVVVVFSGQGICADSVLIEYAELYRQQDAVIVTNDRELQQLTKEHGITLLRVQEFYSIMAKVTAQEAVKKEQRYADTIVTKLHDEEDEVLDALMTVAALGRRPCKDDKEHCARKKQAKSDMKSKQDKQKAALRRKLH